MALKKPFILVALLVSCLSNSACQDKKAPAIRGQDNVATAVLPQKVTVSKSANAPVLVPVPAPPVPAVTPVVRPVAAPPLTPTNPVTPVVSPIGFKLVGIVTSGNVRMALLEDSAGAGYTVKIGSRLGEGNDVVKSIGMDDVIILRDRSLERIRLGN